MPPSGEVSVAEAAADSSQSVELGSGHPGEGRRRGRAPGERWLVGGGSPALGSQARGGSRSGGIEGGGRERTRKATCG
jgi:hypothetical protein